MSYIKPILLSTFIDLSNQWCKLVNKINWTYLSEKLSPLYPENDNLYKSIRLMSSLVIIKQYQNISEKVLLSLWKDNPYYQSFSGEKYFQYQEPCSVSDLELFDRLIGEEGILLIHSELINANIPIDSSGLCMSAKELKEYYFQFQTTLDAIDSIIYVADMDTYDLLYTNKAFIDIFGDKIGQKCYSVIQDGRTSPCEFCTNHLLIDSNGEPNASYEWESQNIITNEWCIQKDKAIRWSDGKLVRIEVAINISKRKKAEDALRESEEKYKRLIENQGEGLAIVNRNEEFTFVNFAAEKIFGVEQRKLLGRNLREFLDDQQYELIRKQTKNRQQNNITTYGLEIKLDNKEIKYIIVTASPEKDVNGNIIGTLGIFRDVTSEKKLHDELRVSEENYKKLFHNNLLAFWEWDISAPKLLLDEQIQKGNIITKGYFDNNKGIFTQCMGTLSLYNFNQAALDLLKYNNESDLINDLRSIITPKAFDTFKNELVNIANNKKSFREETELIDSKGNILSVIIQFEVITENKRAIFSVTDITEQKILTKEIIKAKKEAEASDQLKTSFLTNVSQEVRIPMNAILGFSSIMKNSSVTDVERMKYIDIIINNGNNLLNMINDIIDFSKMESDSLPLNPGKFALNDFLYHISLFFEPILESKKEQVKFTYFNSLPDGYDIIMSDELRLRQILKNLIGNAIKFTNFGTIEVKYIIKDTDKILFSIKDTGIGIADTELPIIFNRFRQIDDSLARKYGGSGIGLALSKACTKLLGGEIWVESEFAKGSTFYFTIPYKPIMN